MPNERDCFDHFVEGGVHSELNVPAALTLGLLAARKWDRADTAQPAGRRATAEQALTFDSFTDSELTEFRAAAMRGLMHYVGLFPRRSWWPGIAQSVIAGFIYAVLLALSALVIKLNGSDAVTVLRSLFGPMH